MQRRSVVFPQPDGPTNHELAVLDRQVDSVDGAHAVRKHLDNRLQLDPRHLYPFNPVVTMPRASRFCKTKNAMTAGSVKSRAPARTAGISRFCAVGS